MTFLRYFQSKLFLVHSVVFAILSISYISIFSAKTDLNDFDARFTAMMANYQIRDTQVIFSFRSDFLSGLGNLQQGYLWRFDPVSYMGVKFGEIYNPYAVTIIVSILLFFCSFVFATKFKASQKTAIFIAYLVPVSTVWSHAHGLVDNQTYALVPQFGSLLLFSMLLVVCIESIGFGTLWRNIVWSFGSFILILYMCAVLTQTLITTFFLIGSVCIGSLIKLFVDRQFAPLIRRLISLFAIVVVLWLLGVVDFLNGFYRNTAVTQNARESFDPSPLRETASFIYESFFPFSNGRVMQVAFLLISVYLIRGLFFKKLRDALYFSTVSATVLIFAYRLWQREWTVELGPRHGYFVWILVPLYASSVAQSIEAIFEYASRILNFSLAVAIKTSLAKTLAYIPVIIVVSVLFTLGDVKTAATGGRPFPVELNRTEQYLVEQISFKPNGEFKGRLVDVNDRPNFEAFFLGRIPAINDVSHLITPLAFEFFEHYFFDPKTVQQRNHFRFVSRNTAVYSLLGVRFLRIESLNPPLNDLTAENSSEPQQFAANDFLVALKNPNLGDYSPTNSFVVETMKETFTTMDNKDFSLVDDVVVYEKIDVSTVKVKSSQLFINGGDLKIVATSQGKSMLIVPLEFSNCYTFRSNDQKSRLIDSFRVNGILTGVLFDKHLDVTAELRYGILTNNDCRLKDLDDYKKLSESE